METKVEELDARGRAKREQVLAGATRVFLREGFAAASTDTLAREAGVSKRTLYTYYPSKEELFADVLRALTIENTQIGIPDFLQGIKLESGAELREALVWLGEKMITILMSPQYLALIRTVIADSHRFPQLAEVVRATVPERSFQEVRALLQRAQERGLVKQGDPSVMTRFFVGPLLSYVLIDGLFRPLSEPQPPSTDQIKLIVDLCMTAISVENAGKE